MRVSDVSRSLQSRVSTTHPSYSQLTFYNFLLQSIKVKCYYFASCSQKTWNYGSSLPGCCGFHTQNITIGIRAPLEFATGIFSRKLDKLTGTAKKWIWEVVLCLFVRINRLWDFGIDHGKRFISFIRAGLCLELFVQTIFHDIFVILSKMSDFGRFWQVFDIVFLMHCGVTTWI